MSRSTVALVHGVWHGAWCWNSPVRHLVFLCALVELDGGHSPFLARPAELAEMIARVL